MMWDLGLAVALQLQQPTPQNRREFQPTQDPAPSRTRSSGTRAQEGK